MPEKKRRWFPSKGDDPFDTWVEFFLAWIAAMLTLLVIAGILSVIQAGGI